MKLNDLSKLTQTFKSTSQMPVLFLGHGSPMNAIEENGFTQNWNALGQFLPKPNAILCISAHWETQGTHITAMKNPVTIHDFGGFPQALFDVEYPALGSPELAVETKNLVTKTEIELDHHWGLDHGAWSVIKHIYPNADIPVIQMSLDYYQTPQHHYELGKDLAALRKKGVLIIGSGNIVHNLRIIDWQNPKNGYDWAEEANSKMKDLIMDNNHNDLIHYKALGKAFELSIPSPEHYLPLLYILALKEKNENTIFFNDTTIMGSIAMTSLIIS